MPYDGVSRRRFLQNVAAGSTGAALASMPVVTPASSAASPPGAPFPVTVESYPLAEPGKGAAVDHLKIATQEEIADQYQQKVRGYSPGVELKFCKSESEFRREIEERPGHLRRLLARGSEGGEAAPLDSIHGGGGRAHPLPGTGRKPHRAHQHAARLRALHFGDGRRLHARARPRHQPLRAADARAHVETSRRPVRHQRHDRGHRGTGWHWDGNCSPRAFRLWDEHSRRRSEAAAQAGFRRGTTLRRLAAQDGAAS